MSKLRTETLAADFGELKERLAALRDGDRARLVTERIHTIHTASGPRTISSWQIPEFKYVHSAAVLPCKARGLFTDELRILVRGYDKFFNVGEYEMLHSNALRAECSGPFYASTKENGCIVFLAGLADGTLLVCSKNVTGNPTSEGPTFKHFQRANYEIDRQLAAHNTTRAELALALHAMDATAVAELCDDSFEEHILEYPAAEAGFYLHGLNHNEIRFRTEPHTAVEAFADAWGFRRVETLAFATYAELDAFLTERSATGVYKNREIEGFVVRCKRQGHDFFFKYKFEQPYLLYRQLRLATLKRFSKTSPKPLTEVVLFFSAYQGITLAYLQFAEEYFAAHPAALDAYLDNKGVIGLRKAFLRHLGHQDASGVQILQMESSAKLLERLDALLEVLRTLYCVVTMATTGCGKTTACKTLVGVNSDWRHFQNDDFNRPNDFADAILTALGSHQLVFADRMNYRAKFREDFMAKMAQRRGSVLLPNVDIKYIGLNFLRSAKKDAATEEKVLLLLLERIRGRGDRHQSVHAATDEKRALAQLRDNFKQFQPPRLASGGELPVAVAGAELAGADLNFSLVINVDVDGAESSLEIAKTAYAELTRAFPELAAAEVSEQTWQTAFQNALSYVPTTTKVVKTQKRKPTYYGVGVARDGILSGLADVLHDDPTWKKIVDNQRVQSEFHVTLCHASGAKATPEARAAWEYMGRLFASKAAGKHAQAGEKKPVPIHCDIHVDHVVVVEDKLVTLSVHLGGFLEPGAAGGKRLVLPHANKHLHVTVGTVAPDVKPMMSNTYLQALFEDGELSAGVHEKATFKARVLEWKYEVANQQAFTFY